MPNNPNHNLHDDLRRYPLGKFNFAQPLTTASTPAFISALTALPDQLRNAVHNLTHEQLNTPYRPGGWTIRQVVHHLADSHMNSYIRFKLALTETQPTIKPYFEDRWADLIDSKTEPVEISVNLLAALHHRWVVLLQALTPADWQKTFNHPESGVIGLIQAAGLYAWHGKHHLAHIIGVREANKW